MRKRVLEWLALLPIVFAVVRTRSSDAGLLADSDTAVLLATIRERNAPLSWFAGDWPLFNHFYRPVSTLAFEMDDALYGNEAAGYGWTNALLVAGGAVALYALLRRFFAFPLAWLGAGLFALWASMGVADLDLWIAGLVVATIGLSYKAARLSTGVLVALGIWSLMREVGGLNTLYATTIAWLPGRTATTCGLFALLALATYAGSVIHGAARREPATQPTDPPATRNTLVAEPNVVRSRLYFGFSLLFTALALGSYEQAVTVPALIFGVGLLLAPTFRVRFGAQVLHWGILVSYLVLRAAMVPVAPSGYQRQVFRSGPGVALSLSDYVNPHVGSLQQAWGAASIGPEGFLLPDTWLGVVAIAGVLALWTVVDRASRRNMAIWLGMSFVVFLPMAFLKHFGHYHYLPMALRTGFVLSAIVGLAGAFRRAASPRAAPAPPRPRPAPGSLPHL